MTKVKDSDTQENRLRANVNAFRDRRIVEALRETDEYEDALRADLARTGDGETAFESLRAAQNR